MCVENAAAGIAARRMKRRICREKSEKRCGIPETNLPLPGVVFGDLSGGPDFGQPFLTDDYSTALSSSTRLAYSLPTVNSSPFSIRNAPLKVLPSCGTGFPSTFSSVIR